MKSRTEEHLVAAAKIWVSGGTYREAAALLGVTRRQFYNICESRRDIFPARVRHMETTDEMVEAASAMWMEGKSREAIARHLSIDKRRIMKFAEEDESGKFPPRVQTRTGFIFAAPRNPKSEISDQMPEMKEGRMRWKTEAGAIVTLPKISLIQCPRHA